MMKTTFNNLINIEYPDDFKILTEKENAKYFNGDLLRLTFQNKDKHLLISIAKTRNSFLNRLFGIKTILDGAISNMAKNLKEFDIIEGYNSVIFNKPALTKCFSYLTTKEEIKQYGEFSVFKIKNAFYNVYCLSRFEDKDEYKDLFKQFRDSFTEIR